MCGVVQLGLCPSVNEGHLPMLYSDGASSCIQSTGCRHACVIHVWCMISVKKQKRKKEREKKPCNVDGPGSLGLTLEVAIFFVFDYRK